MSQYRLNLSIDPTYVEYFSKNNWSFCLAVGVQSGAKLVYNMIACATTNIADHITTELAHKYSMAATLSKDENGVIINETTDALPILFGQKFVVPKDFKPTVVGDNTAPNNGFRFSNEPRCSALLFQAVGDGISTPIFMTPGGPLPPHGEETMTPTSTVSIWFQQGAVVGPIGNSGGESIDPFTVAFGPSVDVSVQYTADGTWAITSPSS